jgi:hypothetical protein
MKLNSQKLVQLRRKRRVLQDAKRLAQVVHGPAEAVELLARLEATPDELKVALENPRVLLVILDVVARQLLSELDAAERLLVAEEKAKTAA